MKVVVIGGDAAGMSAASQVKRQQPLSEVIVFERGTFISYAACGIPYYVGGEVGAIENLVEVTPEEARQKRKVDLRLESTVTALDPQARTVTVVSQGSSYVESYDRALIATGARPQTLGIDVGSFENVFTMNDLYDAGRLKRFLAERQPRRIAVVGGGYIGLEALEAFRGLGLESLLVHRRRELNRAFESEMSQIILRKLAEKGVVLHLGQAFSGLEQRGEGVAILSEEGAIEADAVLLAIGVTPNSSLAEAAGIELGVSRAIRVNAYQETSAAGVYAAGDCATANLAAFPLEVHAPLALKANKQGLVAGINMAGGSARFAGVMHASVTKVFDLGVARTGLSFDQARELGLDPEKVVVSSRDRARYYPGAAPITTLVIFSRTNRRLLGAQLAGEISAVKRIDVFTTAIQAGMTIDQVFDLDLAYAPPFSPVYDPVLLAARVARKKV